MSQALNGLSVTHHGPLKAPLIFGNSQTSLRYNSKKYEGGRFKLKTGLSSLYEIKKRF